MNKILTLAAMMLATTALAQDEERPPHPLDSKEAHCIASYTRFRQLHTGQNQSQVYRLMGCDGELRGETRLGNSRIRTFRFEGDKPGSAMVVVYEDRKIISLQQIGLQ